MKLIGLMPVRNEGWILGLSLRAALMWCDEMVVLNHASADETAEVFRQIRREGENAERLWGWTESDEVWDEMRHRRMMLEFARLERGATHIAIIDADEILTGNLLPTIREHVSSLQRDHILALPGYNLRGGIHRYHSNGIWWQRWFSVAFLDDPKLHWAGDRFHQREPQGKPLLPFRPVRQGEAGILHLWGSSERRLIAKHRYYRIQERLRWPAKPAEEIERMYSLATDGLTPGESELWTFADVPDSWWEPYRDLMKYLDIDREPWQEKWCEEMLERYGRERFKGLNV